MIVTPQKTRGVDLVMSAPPSKSYTHRALITGALASGTSTIVNPLKAEDTVLTIAALRTLGIAIEKKVDRVIIRGCDGSIPAGEAVTLDLNNSGTSLRLLTSLALLGSSPVTLTGSARMQERPIGPLADALPGAGRIGCVPEKTRVPAAAGKRTPEGRQGQH